LSVSAGLPAKPAVIFIWSNFGPYHIDRLEAAGAALGETHRVVGIEIAGSSETYAWSHTEQVTAFERITLFADRTDASIPWWRRFAALAKACFGSRARHVFLCNYDHFDVFLLAGLLRLAFQRVFVMMESKFDDKPRRLWRELLKSAFVLPYHGGIVGGRRSRDYLRFFGFHPGRIEMGYDTVSVDRIRRLANSPPAPDGMSFAQRHFTIVARLVPKKNIAMALDAHARYCAVAGTSARELHICGSGLLDSELRVRARELGLSSVVFHGFVQAPEVARILASTLALILPSTEEQWGLVVNEAVAMGLPILCADNVGARDLLVRTAVNGFIFEPDSPLGLANILLRLANDEVEWRRLAEGSLRLASLADARYFGAGAARLVCGHTGTAASHDPSVVIDASS
jgi:glycosyltransferase involved in cell wall biosynthesis